MDYGLNHLALLRAPLDTVHPVTVGQKWEWIHSLFPVSDLPPTAVVTAKNG